MVNSIGAYNVRNWLRGMPPQTLGPTLQVLEYPGQDYQAFRELGIRSEQFKMESIVDFATAARCYQELADYKNIVGDGAYQIIWNNLNFDTLSIRVVVLGVRAKAVQQRAIICGGLNPPSLVDLHCEWDLMAVPWSA